MNGEIELTERIDALDVTLFDDIDAQLNDSDKRTLLALASGFRQAYGTYTYLEIGSHLGGSLQSVVRDPACTRIVSIDPRPELQPDERKGTSRYPGNSTEQMIALLARVPGARLDKLETVEATTAELDPAAYVGAPTFCFVDGEHTDVAVRRDADFCRRVTGGAGVIAFHDTSTIYRGLHGFLSALEEEEAEYTAYLLPHSVFVVELAPARVLEAPQVLTVLRRSGRRTIAALMDNDFYRSAWERWPFRLVRPKANRRRLDFLPSRRRA